MIGKLEIVSGEGEVGRVKVYRGKLTARAVKARILKEARDGRWAGLLWNGQPVDYEQIDNLFSWFRRQGWL